LNPLHGREQQSDAFGPWDAPRLQKRFERSAVEPLHDEEQCAAVFVDVVDVDDVRVLNSPGRTRLADETLHPPRIVSEAPSKPLEGDGLVGDDVSCREDGTDASFAQFSLHAVFPVDDVAHRRQCVVGWEIGRSGQGGKWLLAREVRRKCGVPRQVSSR
jgi:hypothetical protein